MGHMVIKGLVSYVWWKGASNVIILRAFFRIWELAILLVSAYMAAHEDYSFDCGSIKRLTQFVGIRGLVDLVHELSLVAGHVRIGMWREYGSSGWASKLMDWASVIISILLIIDPGNRNYMMLGAFSRWLLLWQVFLVADKVARIVVPLHRLLVAVLPATVVTLTVFAMICHCMFYLQDHAYQEDKSIDLESFFKSMFSLLFTNQLPDDHTFDDPSSSVLVYTSSLVFSIFYLNIFIAILGGQYEKEVKLTERVISHKRSIECY